jgi:2-oxoglutarate ferredoxin oxidoreductase subunit beta
MSVPKMRTYLKQDALPYFFCPGCGHGAIVDHLNAALVKLQIDPNRVVIVTDIGCSGLADRYFATNAFHGLHGRSVTYASGIKLANPDLKVIVLMGDGGCGIGGHHLINAARRNIGVTVIVFNNLNYGMTGGEHSVTTPPGAVTSTTPYGQLERPLDICRSVAVNGASFVARTTAFDRGLPDLMAEAILNEGFSLLDIWELCTAYFVPNNRFSKSLLEQTLQDMNFESGSLFHDERPEFSRAYRQATADQLGKLVDLIQAIVPKYQNNLDHELSFVISGTAGKKIVSAASAFCRGAVLSGLWAAQRNDYPVTVKSGYSQSEVVFSPQKIIFAGIPRPDIMLVLFREGLQKAASRIENLAPENTLYISRELLPIRTQAQIKILDFSGFGKVGRKKENWALMALAVILKDFGIYPLEAFKEAAAMNSIYAQENLAAIQAAYSG